MPSTHPIVTPATAPTNLATRTLFIVCWSSESRGARTARLTLFCICGDGRCGVGLGVLRSPGTLTHQAASPHLVRDRHPHNVRHRVAQRRRGQRGEPQLCAKQRVDLLARHDHHAACMRGKGEAPRHPGRQQATPAALTRTPSPHLLSTNPNPTNGRPEARATARSWRARGRPASAPAYFSRMRMYSTALAISSLRRRRCRVARASGREQEAVGGAPTSRWPPRRLFSLRPPAPPPSSPPTPLRAAPLLTWRARAAATAGPPA